MKHSINDCKLFASLKGGKCISDIYISTSAKMFWECDCGHRWSAKWGNVLHKKSWCPSCAGHVATIDEMHSISKQRKGECLSIKYINNRKLLKFRCQHGHEFEMSSRSVKRGQWCKYCSKYITQEKIRYMLQIITGKPWNQNRKVIYPYELDMYSPDDNMAFEYNGRQHYFEIKHYHRHKDSFRQQQDRDIRKVSMCKEKGMRFFVITFLDAKTDENLLIIIKKYLSENNITTNEETVRLSEFYSNYNHCSNRLMKIKKIAQTLGGECISEFYINNDTKLQFKCKENHTWESTPHNIISGRWCSKCARFKQSMLQKDRNQNRLDRLKQISKDRNGKCLSDFYTNRYTKMRFRCNTCKNEWESIPASIIIEKSWCPKCANIRKGKKIILQ